MSALSQSVKSKIESVVPRLDELEPDLERIVNERCCDVAETISGVPYQTVRDILESRAGFCLCRAVRKIAAGEDAI
jgi:hypothetical protein